MRKKWKNLVRIVLLVVAGAVLGVNLYNWNAKSLMGNSLPMPFGCGVAVVLSGSMVVVHRIIQVEPDTVITQGDANNAPDAPIRKEMIKGKVVHWIPGAGRIARLLKSPVATVILVGGALLLSELTLRKEKKKDEDELEKIKAEIRRLKAEQE